MFFSFGRLTIQVSHSGNRILWVKTITDISCHILNPPAVWVASCNIRSMLFVHHSAGLKKKKKSFTLSIPSKIIQLSLAKVAHCQQWHENVIFSSQMDIAGLPEG